MTRKTTTAGSDTDWQAILDVLAGLYKAGEANDAEAFVADYTDDASVVQPGVYKKDREEIRARVDHGQPSLPRVAKPAQVAGELQTAVTLAPSEAEQRLLHDRLRAVRSEFR